MFPNNVYRIAYVEHIHTPSNSNYKCFHLYTDNATVITHNTMGDVQSACRDSIDPCDEQKLPKRGCEKKRPTCEKKRPTCEKKCPPRDGGPITSPQRGQESQSVSPSNATRPTSPARPSQPTQPVQSNEPSQPTQPDIATQSVSPNPVSSKFDTEKQLAFNDLEAKYLSKLTFSQAMIETPTTQQAVEASVAPIKIETALAENEGGIISSDNTLQAGCNSCSKGRAMVRTAVGEKPEFRFTLLNLDTNENIFSPYFNASERMLSAFMDVNGNLSRERVADPEQRLCVLVFPRMAISMPSAGTLAIRILADRQSTRQVLISVAEANARTLPVQVRFGERFTLTSGDVVFNLKVLDDIQEYCSVCL